VYDPRREERRQLTRVPLPDDVEPRDLDPDVRQDLRSLSKDTADAVARHLVMTGRLLDDDPTQALAHARAAGALAGRIGVVRETLGLAAYTAQEWAEALSELRTARRITGRADNLPVIADCERALGRPERALAQLEDPDVPKLEQSVRVELVIVAAGARRDLGQADAAVLLLQGPARATTARRPWATRLWYAFADALLAAGRDDEGREWFAKAAEHDGQGETDAMERLLELDGVVLEDLQEDDADEDDDAPYEGPDDLSALLSSPVASGDRPDDVSGGASADQPAEPSEPVADVAAPDGARADSVTTAETGAEAGAEPPAVDAMAAEIPISATRVEPEPEREREPEPEPEPERSAGPLRTVPFAGSPDEPVAVTRPASAIPGVAFVAADPVADDDANDGDRAQGGRTTGEPDARDPEPRTGSGQDDDGDLTLFD
jgi:hypothetical protein